jgi:hypothetical protein
LLPITQPCPQPDYSVGFKQTVFTEDQYKKLQSFINLAEKFYYIATYYIYLLFLTCKIKYSTAALDIADRQNTYSMTVAVKGIVELFRLVGYKKELYQEILAFSILYNNRTVRIYSYYPVINRKDTIYYCYLIYIFDFTALDGKEK